MAWFGGQQVPTTTTSGSQSAIKTTQFDYPAMEKLARTRKEGPLPLFPGRKNNWAANKSLSALKWEKGKEAFHSHCVQRNLLVWCFALTSVCPPPPHRFDHWAEADRELRASRVFEFVLFPGTSCVTQTYLAAFARLNAFMAFFATIHVSHTHTHTYIPKAASSPLCNTYT